MNCSDCDSSGLDSPNSSWSIARLKEYLRRKTRTIKREKNPSFSNVIISTDIVTSNPSVFSFLFFFFFFFFFSFFFLISFSFLFLSCLLCSPTSIAILFLQSCLTSRACAWCPAGLQLPFKHTQARLPFTQPTMQLSFKFQSRNLRGLAISLQKLSAGFITHAASS